MNKKFVSYIRVSTDKQGVSGLGLQAQKKTIADAVKGRGKVIKTFREVESGRKFYRQILDDALIYCREHDATLIVAKLDRLARSVWLFSCLQKTGTPFEIVGLPNNPLVLQILASVAEWEARAISERTKSALAVKKAQGKKLGFHNPKVRRGVINYWKTIKKTKQVMQKKLQATKLKKPIKQGKIQLADTKVWNTINILRQQHYSYESIAQLLNQAKVPSRNGKKWYQTSVFRVAKRNTP